MLDETALDVLLTKQALREHIQNYARSIDRLDRQLMETIWWPDAEVEYEGFMKAGPEQIIDSFMEVHKGYATHHHQLGNMNVTVDGDQAASETYVTAVLRSYPDETGRCVDTVIRGRYFDRWERREGTWKISNRFYVSDIYSEYNVVKVGEEFPLEQLLTELIQR